MRIIENNPKFNPTGADLILNTTLLDHRITPIETDRQQMIYQPLVFFKFRLKKDKADHVGGSLLGKEQIEVVFFFCGVGAIVIGGRKALGPDLEWHKDETIA